MKIFFSSIKFLKSIRFRIILLVVCAGIIPPVFLTSTLLYNYENRAIESRTTTIITQAQLLISHILSEDYINEHPNSTLEDQIDLLGGYYDGRIMIIDSDFKIIYDTYGLDTGKTIMANGVFECFENTQTTNYDYENEYIEVSIPITEVDTQDVIGAVLIASSTSEVAGNIDYMTSTSIVFVVALLFLIVCIAIFGSAHLVKPFDRVSDIIGKVQPDSPDDPVMVMDYTETEALSEAFNELLDRVKTLDEARAAFVSNVSHELKTPLASMKVLADSLLEQEDAPVEAYRDFMGDIAQEIDRENGIITDLLSLVKMDQKSGGLNISQVNVNELIEMILKRLKPLADKKEVELVFESLRPVVAELDEVKISLAINNLIENSVKYNVDGGWVHVSLNADNQFFYLKVEDSGIGISEDDIAHIFDRFYRADKSHSREIGGTGLGLSIVRSSVLMHRGAVAVDSTLGKGSTFSIRVPLYSAGSEGKGDKNEENI
ncbi:MAG: HAMP domain-containing histidine kinase [Eubacterium sp.]|nr:HAMP domain-containing histidine kinase [Eubacterium sp.]